MRFYWDQPNITWRGEEQQTNVDPSDYLEVLMASDNKDEGEPSRNVSVGKEIDAALGEVIRGLFQEPAKEVGNLMGDAIGILGDRVKRKRELNAKLGIEDVRKKLEASNVDMKDITPPKEEELHLLINGLSLAGNENVRDMWAGLFAKALEPKSNVTAERPFISVLESLSPLDAKVIDFLAYTMKTDKELRETAANFRPRDLKNITLEEKVRMNSTQASNMELQKNAIQAIERKANEYGLKSFSDPSWAENLMRQGLIERTPLQQKHLGSLQVRSLDEEGILQVFEHLNEQVGHIEQSTKRSASAPDKLFSKAVFGSQIQLEVQFSSFGQRFAQACGVL